MEDPALFCRPITFQPSPYTFINTHSDLNITLIDIHNSSHDNVFVTCTQIELAKEYLHFCELYPPRHMKTVRSHLMKYLHRYLARHTNIRDMLGQAKTMDDMFAVCQVIPLFTDIIES